jgi:hypothetical protein
MEEQYSDEPEETQGEPIEIYSKWAIRIFSLFMTPIFGGVLLIISIRKAGFKEGTWSILFFSIAYTFFTTMLLGGLGLSGGVFPMLVYFGGGMILSDVYYKKYFPDDDYYPKPVWSAILVAITINVSAFLLLYYTGHLPPDMMKLLNKK